MNVPDSSPQHSLQSPTEDACGVGIDRLGVSEVRAHCVYEWENLIRFQRVDDRRWKLTMTEEVTLTPDRMRTLGYALIEATND